MSTPSDSVLLADIGGTNARFALADPGADVPLRLDSVRTSAVADFPSLHDAAAFYLQEVGERPRSAVIAVAGRVDGDEARITNHPWVISRQRTGDALQLHGLRLINDFAAQALAITLLGRDDVVAIGGVDWTPSHDGDRTYGVIGPGTGLGVGALLRRDGRTFALPSEGGHVSFAPGTPEEARILEDLSAEFGRVSIERIVSGMGLVNLHRALSRIASDDSGPLTARDIVERARDGDVRCGRVLDVFCAVFGAVTGDLVLTLGAWDGVFLAGGVATKVLAELQHSGFRQRFEHKGRFSAAMARVPTLAVVHPQPGLLGAAAMARLAASGDAG